MADLQAFLTPQVTTIAVALLAAFSIGGIIYAIFEPVLSGRKAREKRMESVSSRSVTIDAARRAKDGDRRRKSVQDQLKEFESREKKKAQKAARLSIEDRIDQAGLSWSRTTFFVFSGICAVVLMLVGLFATGSLLLTAGLAFVGVFGVPRFYLARRRKKRMNAFLNELPNAVDVVVRGTKAGLPLGECIQIVSAEAREPIRTEFKRIVEAQTMGITLAEAVSKLPARMPVAEANFFAIVIMIQSQSGGSLSEALGNLSKVLRERKAMKGKIVAMSQEAKSSAAIIGSLPFLVIGALSVLSPSYMMVLFTDPAGKIIVGASVIWMMMGLFIMKKMINFDF
ncbi:type II secretion system F family protein [Stappia sp.]|uniref:type II secretion system F family protein n=1 Tax=Stappia sp. TaxID=1870903 RepID=UPI003A9A5363